MTLFTPFSFFLLALPLLANWPQAAGPNNNYIAAENAQAPAAFSVSTNHNIRWRAPLPSTGQSSPVVWGTRVFVTSHEAISADSETGSMIYGMCFDAATGTELWRRELPGARVTDLSSLFNDNTAAAPVTDGNHVLFMNVGGMMACFDFDGGLIWKKQWVPFGRHHARAHQPFLHDGAAVVMRCPRDDFAVEVTTKPGAAKLGRGREVWTHLMAYDLASGALRWQAEPGTTVHCVSMPGRLKSGAPAILTGRGGGHKPPEEPFGLSLLSAVDGSTIWERAVPKYAAAQVARWNDQHIAAFVGSDHVRFDPASGGERARRSLLQLDAGDTLWRYQPDPQKWRQAPGPVKAKGAKAVTYYTNIIVGDYHFFRAFAEPLIGRVHLPSGRLEYLEVPVQVVRQAGQPERRLWGIASALPNELRTATGFLATSDKRNRGSGWGHVSSATPIVVGDHIYLPTMLGIVYVLKWNAPELGPDALVSVSDLGPAQDTWSLAGLAFADGAMYARTLKELIRIGSPAD